MSRIYVYEPSGHATGSDRNVKVAKAVYPGKQMEETSTLGSVGKGASIGATAGSAVPIPGVGTAVGSAVGSLVGLGVSLFGGGVDQTQMHKVLPTLLQPIFAKAGAQTQYKGASKDGFGTKPLHVSGKSFEPSRVRATIRKALEPIARKDGVKFNDKGNLEHYMSGLEMSRTKPADTGGGDGSPDIILSFPEKVKTAQATQDAQTHSPTGPTRSANAEPILYAAAAIAAAFVYIR